MPLHEVDDVWQEKAIDMRRIGLLHLTALDEALLALEDIGEKILYN